MKGFAILSSTRIFHLLIASKIQLMSTYVDTGVYICGHQLNLNPKK